MTAAELIAALGRLPVDARNAVPNYYVDLGRVASCARNRSGVRTLVHWPMTLKALPSWAAVSSLVHCREARSMRTWCKSSMSIVLGEQCSARLRASRVARRARERPRLSLSMSPFFDQEYIAFGQLQPTRISLVFVAEDDRPVFEA